MEKYDLVKGPAQGVGVYKTRRKIDGKPVVIKWGDISRREVSILKLCQCVPGVVGVIETFKQEEKLGIVMKLCDEDLFDFINREGPITEKRARPMMYSLLKTLAGVHRLGICHRDIKVENVLVKKEKVFLCDFGFAKRMKASHKKACGTPHTVAPELLEGGPYDGEAVDIWALGCTFYALLHGKYPFWTTDEGGERLLFQNIRFNRRRGFRSDLSNEVQVILDKMMSFDPAERPSAESVANYDYFFCYSRQDNDCNDCRATCK